MNASQGVLYCAGMGVTIEVGVLSVPSVKILGFHTEHASNDLARNLGIGVVSAFDIENAVSPKGETWKLSPKGKAARKLLLGKRTVFSCLSDFFYRHILDFRVSL